MDRVWLEHVSFIRPVVFHGVVVSGIVADWMRGFRIPSEKSPKQPVMSHDRFMKLRAVANESQMQVIWNGKRESRPTYFRDLLDLADGTGRRLSALCQLHATDIDLDRGEYGTRPFSVADGAIPQNLRWDRAGNRLGVELAIVVAQLRPKPVMSR